MHNVAQRVQVSSDATPGAQHTIAILAAIPETVNGRPTNGMRVQFETCVDDYGEIWIDGECNRDRGTVQGFNVAQRVQVSSDATPGAQHTIAILAANGPLAAPFGTVFVRFANLGFEWTGS